MNNITFISTVHQENGKCNADELCSILEKLNPKIVFLEALENTYSKCERTIFTSFSVFHKKLEIKAIQQYSNISSIEYIPVLDIGLSDLFDKKYTIVSENKQLQKMNDNFNTLASDRGFQFLNSTESINHQGKMRLFENQLVEDTKLLTAVSDEIDTYENSMMKNILKFCRNNQFEKAVFLCGVAHRHSIIEKIKDFNRETKMKINWEIYGT